MFMDMRIQERFGMKMGMRNETVRMAMIHPCQCPASNSDQQKSDHRVTISGDCLNREKLFKNNKECTDQ